MTLRKCLWVFYAMCSAAGFAVQADAATVSYTPSLVSGWNLIGNSTTTPITVASVFGDKNKYQTVWKWNATNSKWQVYAPSLDAAPTGDGTLAAYAASKGFEVLTNISGGEGYWVNATASGAGALSGAAASAVTGISLGKSQLVTGWNLVATGDNLSPADFNRSLSGATSGTPANLTSLWAWDAVNAAWQFYAPTLDGAGTLTSYITSKNYRDFGSTTLGNGLGFWVNFTAAPAVLPTDYSCDLVKEAAIAPRTTPLVRQYDSVPPELAPTLTFERWSMLVDGQANELNIAISKPAAGVPIRGVVVNGHGISPSNSSLPPSAMVDTYWDPQVTSRGYISVTVARRGNFGSTGERLGLSAQYQSGQNSYADLALAVTKYQSASLVAALQKMSADSAYQPYLSTILLIGGSGGADTVLQTAADSVVFQSAIKKGLIRFAGLNSVSFDTNLDVLHGVSESTARIAASTTSSLWIIGEDDSITSVGQLACQFKFFNQAAGFPNLLYVVPGMGHEGEVNLFTPTLSEIFTHYITNQGFEGF